MKVIPAYDDNKLYALYLIEAARVPRFVYGEPIEIDIPEPPKQRSSSDVAVEIVEHFKNSFVFDDGWKLRKVDLYSEYDAARRREGK